MLVESHHCLASNCQPDELLAERSGPSNLFALQTRARSRLPLHDDVIELSPHGHPLGSRLGCAEGYIPSDQLVSPYSRGSALSRPIEEFLVGGQNSRC